MRTWILGAMALALGTAAIPAAAQDSSVKAGDYWTASRVVTEPGQFENYMDYLTRTWAPNQEFAKSQGWITGYHILSNVNARDGEPDIILITRFADMPSVAEGERRDKIMNDRMKQNDHSADTASGARTKLRRLAGSILYRELGKR